MFRNYKINLYIDEENTDIYVSKQTNRLYWPETLFSGEILTKFDYSEEPVLSEFTLAFLRDLPFLKFKKEYSGDLARFGKYAGCSPICGNFLNNENNFWDCSACIEGYFKAIESSESDEICENNNNKDYYFLYNEASQIYKKCELEIQNCQKCSSQTICTLCKNGYKLEDKDGTVICEKEDEKDDDDNDKDDDDDGLSTGAIIGIVFGCAGFLLIVALIIFCLIMRKKETEKENPEKKIVETAKEEGKDPLEDDIKVIEYDKKSEIMDATAKRINNKSKNIV